MYEEVSTFRSPASTGSLQNFVPESSRHEIVEAPMDEEFDEEEAAFCAEAEAFARKCDVHELAVQRLVQDLVEDDELEASKKQSNSSLGMKTDEMGSVTIANDSTMEPQRQENVQNGRDEGSNEANSAHTGMEQIEAGSLSKTKALVNDTSGLQSPMQDNKRTHKQANNHSGFNQNGKKAHQLDHMASKKRIYPMKEKAQDKPLSQSPSKTQATSPLKPSKSTNPSSVKKLIAEPDKVCTSSFSTSKRLLDNDRIQTKVKEFPHTRKPADSAVSSERNGSSVSRENPDLGPFLLKLAKQTIACGDKPQKALEYAARAAKAYEVAADGKHSLDLVMSLHVLAALHCSLGQFEEAVTVLKHSLNVPTLEAGVQEHALAAFAGYMQLGDTFALLGKGEEALSAYRIGLDVQMGALGEKDPRVGETCRYLAEAHAQALQFDKAEELCQHALDIHREHSVPASVEEATDRRLMGLIYNGKGQYEAALEHLVLASMALITNGRDIEVAAVDASIGDTYVLLGRLDEAVFSYQKALTVLKAAKGESHVTVASLYISLAELYLKTGKLREARAYCESALRIFTKQGGGPLLEEVATGLTEIAIIYEALNEHEHALSFLQKALVILETAPGQQSAVAGVEAQIGVFHYMHGDYEDARTFFSKAVSKLRASAEKNSPLFGIVLNQMGLSCVQLSDIQAAVDIFEESRSILEAVCGPHHPDTLSVNSNLAGAYDAVGRLDDAIAVLEYTLEAREDMHGIGDMEVEDEKARLAELLKEARQPRARKYHSSLHSTVQANT